MPPALVVKSPNVPQSPTAHGAMSASSLAEIDFETRLSPCQRPRVTVIGAGPAGFALAADMQQRGTNVLIYSHPEHLRHANQVEARGALQACGLLEGFMAVRITSSMASAVAFSKIILIAVPSTGQETILAELKHFDLRLHTLISIPGNLFSLIADSQLTCVANILETNLSPYSCRMEDGGKLLVLGVKSRMLIAAFRHNDSPALRRQVQAIFPMIELIWATSVVEVSLANINGVFHPLMQLMNAGWIESTGGDFFLYAQGLSRSVANAMEAVDKVRLAIGDAFGFDLRSTVDESNSCYGQNFTDLVELARVSPPHCKLRAPADGMANRNITEDVPDLLVCWHGLAEQLGLDAAPLAAVVTLASMATGKDFMASGRNMRKLRLESLSKMELIERFGHIGEG